MKSFPSIKQVLFVSALLLAQANVAFAISPEVVTPHVTDMTQLLNELKGVTTTQQAQAYSGVVQGKLPMIKMQHKKMIDAIPVFEKASKEGKVTPAMKTAGNQINTLNSTVLPQLEMEMHRVEKLNPSMKPHFDVVRELNQ